jgi:putative transposase
MPRQLRVFVPDVAAHVTHRSTDRQVCFRADNDRILYLQFLRELSERHHVRIHAYCLMGNHVHLLLSPSSGDGCQLMMKGLAQRYSLYFNRTHGRCGALWGGRYYSCIAESALYVLACYRYIEMNPVRAGMTSHPAGYRWSSYRSNANGYDDGLVTPHDEFLALGTEELKRRRAYEGLFNESLELAVVERIRASTAGGYPLASDSFKAKFEAVHGVKLEAGRPGPRP